MKLILVTACGAKKENGQMPAWKLYKSARIRHLKKVAEAHGVPLFILSARHGLISSDAVIDPYDEVMTEERFEILKPVVISQLRKLKRKGLRRILFYRGGARKLYLDLLMASALKLSLNVIYYGSGNMRDIGLTPYLLERLVSRNGDISTNRRAKA